MVFENGPCDHHLTIFQVYQLKQHCKTLEGELDDVKSEIVRILSEKEGFFKENGTLRDYKKSYEDLKEENMQLKKERKKLNEKIISLKVFRHLLDTLFSNILYGVIYLYI